MRAGQQVTLKKNNKAVYNVVFKVGAELMVEEVSQDGYIGSALWVNASNFELITS